jgi:predicted Zn-dependent protease
MKAHFRAAGFLVVAAALLLAGCETVSTLTDIGVASGKITESQAESIQKSAKAVEKSFEDITPEQEYYIGRAVAAVVLDKYAPYPEAGANEYLNLLGQSLARASDRPETFGGYHFLILDSDEINAFAAPGGLVLVSRGLLRCADGEDAAAAILAHEITHVAKKHGLQAIKTSRVTAALTSVALTASQTAGSEDLAALTSTFQDSITDITSTLVNSGYSRALESEADRGAVEILRRVGYDPNALVRMLKVMDKKIKPGGLDFAKTHPDPEDRIKDVEKTLAGKAPPPSPPQKRAARYTASLGKI